MRSRIRRSARKWTRLNQADSMIFTTENFLKDNGDKIPADKKPAIEQALQQAQGCSQGSGPQCHRHCYRSPQLCCPGCQCTDVRSGRRTAGCRPGLQGGAGAGAGQQGAQQNNSKSDDNIQDADFEEVK